MNFKALIPETQVSQSTSLDPSSIISINPIEIFSHYANPDGLLMFGLMGGMFLAKHFSGSKSQLSTGRLAGKKELVQAAFMSLKQMRGSGCQPSTLWAGTPSYWFGENKISAFVQTALGIHPTTFFPDAGRGLLILGVPGSGKTFSVIDRVIESAFVQGFSGIIYDKKGSQLELHLPLATSYGYEAEVIAPGEKYSGVYNPLDCMKDCEDAIMAGQIGKVIIDNSGFNSGKGDNFFEKTGGSLATGAVQLAKSSKKYSDLALVYAILKLDKLIERLKYAVNRSDAQKLNPWIEVNFATFLGSADAEKTAACIKAQAQIIYSSFIQKDLLRCFIGKSTIDLRLSGKQLLIFKLDDKRREVIAPLLASLIQLCVVENLSTKRQNPFFYALDELPSLVLQDLDNWINEYRSHGGVPIIGIQNPNQLYESWGKEKGDSIMSGLKTHVLFDPGDLNTAEKYSVIFGNKDVIVKNVTVNCNGNSISRSVSSQIHSVPLISKDTILRFPQGKCIISSPGYGNKLETNFPRIAKIPVPMKDIIRIAICEKEWSEVFLPYYTYKAVQRTSNIDVSNELQLRVTEAKRLLPLPDEEFTETASDQSDFDRILQKREAAAK
ncbi:MAG: type IV secretion system DNA-binding domain-containing protein [Prochloraceae cyanobacterium]|nr:type IV secretion system DNA-binding domain-containing protein [Prochloraceae cyanobacterium]